MDTETQIPKRACRSPHGERGLKSVLLVDVLRGRVALLMESVD